MFKKILLGSLLVLTLSALIFGAVNRTLAKTAADNSASGLDGYGGGRGAGRQNSGATASGGGYGNGGGSAVGGGNAVGSGNAVGGGNGLDGGNAGELTYLPAADPNGVSAEEAAALIYMREEEKLAHDVYVALYAQWGLASFQNISQSEQTHTDAVKALLDRYALADPASAQAGVFTNPDLQALYTQLAAQGSVSLADALKVGAAIEEIDILDLDTRLAQSDNADIQQVFSSLRRASENHLRAFATNLQNQTGETYLPQYLSADAYQAIAGAANGNGRGGGQGGGQGGGNGRGNHGAQP